MKFRLWSVVSFRYVEIIQEIHYPMLLSNQITQMRLQKVQSVKLGLSKPCCLVCNYVICRICKDDRLSSVSYSGHHNHMYPCTLPDDLPEAVLSETRHWIETLLRDHLTSSEFQRQLVVHLKLLGGDPSMVVRARIRCVSPPVSVS